MDKHSGQFLTAQQTEEQFRNKIAWFKYFLTVSVVYIHAYNVEIYSPVFNDPTGFTKFIKYFEDDIRIIQECCVPFFFIISGYLFFRTFDLSKIKEKYLSRVQSVVVPYVIWSTTGFLYFFVLTHLPFVKDTIHIEKVELSLRNFFVNSLIKSEFDGPLWYVSVLILYILICPIVYVLLRDWFKKIKTGRIVLVLLWIFYSLVEWKSIYFQLPYFFGAYIGINDKELPKQSSVKIRFIGIIVACITFFFIESTVSIAFISEIKYIVFSCAIWCATCGLKWTKKVPWIAGTGVSFLIYAMHSFVLEGLEKVLLLVFGYHGWAALIDYLFAPVVTIILITSFAAILKKYPRIYRILTGSR